MVNAELKTEINQLKSQLLQKDQKILQLENEISSRLPSPGPLDEPTASCPKKGKQEPIIEAAAGVHFYVQRWSNLGSAKGGAIPFEFASVNEGNAFDLSSGIFTAPVNGFYHFQFSALKYDSAEYDETFLIIAIGLNGGFIDFSRPDKIGLIEYGEPGFENVLGTFKSVSLSTPLRLKKGYEVSLVNIGGAGKLADNASFHYSFFTGWLVEDISEIEFINYPCLLFAMS